MDIIKESRSLIIDQTTLQQNVNGWTGVFKPAVAEHTEWLSVLDKYIAKHNPVYVEFGPTNTDRLPFENDHDRKVRLLSVDETRIGAYIAFDCKTEDGGYEVEIKGCGPFREQVEQLLISKTPFALSMKGYAEHTSNGDAIVEVLTQVTALNLLGLHELKTPVTPNRLKELGYSETVKVMLESLPLGYTLALAYDVNGNPIQFPDQQNDMN